MVLGETEKLGSVAAIPPSEMDFRRSDPSWSVPQSKRRPIRLAPNHGYSARPPYVIEQVRQFLETKYVAIC